MMSPRHPPLPIQASDVITGSVFGWLIFSGLVGLVTFIAVVVDRGTVGDFAWEGSADIVQALIAGACALFVGGIVSFFATAVMGLPLAFAARALLKRTDAWQLHLVGAALVGIICGVSVSTVGSLGIVMIIPELFAPIVVLAAVATGLSAALGWVVLWHRSVRRAGFVGESAPLTAEVHHA